MGQDNFYVKRFGERRRSSTVFNYGAGRQADVGHHRKDLDNTLSVSYNRLSKNSGLIFEKKTRLPAPAYNGHLSRFPADQGRPSSDYLNSASGATAFLDPFGHRALDHAWLDFKAIGSDQDLVSGGCEGHGRGAPMRWPNRRGKKTGSTPASCSFLSNAARLSAIADLAAASINRHSIGGSTRSASSWRPAP